MGKRNVNYILFIVLFAINLPVLTQKKENKSGMFLLSAGMGIDYSSTPSYTDYLRNVLPVYNPDSIKAFSTGIEFFGAFEYAFTKTLSAKLDYSYYLRSNHYSFPYYGYVFDYTISAHQPYIMLFYCNRDRKFSFKIGGGAGYHFQTLKNSINPQTSLTYTSHGLTFKGEFIFTPRFSEKLETYISGFVYGSTTSSLKDENGNILKSTTGKEVNLGGYGVGARLGLSVYLN